MSDTDICFYFDPVCPFAWMTSKWVRQVTAERDYTVDWRFISLRMINAAVDYDSHFPPGYEAGHTAGLKLLRVAARVRADYGRDQVGPLYEAIGTQVFDTEPDERQDRGSRTFLEPILAHLGLPATLADALDDSSFDAELQRETDEALALTGKDVGTPIIHFQPPDGVAFFGPVISRLPDEADATRLWDHVVGLAGFPVSPSSSAACANDPSCAASGSTPTRSASKRTGTAAADAPRTRPIGPLHPLGTRPSARGRVCRRSTVGRRHPLLPARRRTRPHGIRPQP